MAGGARRFRTAGPGGDAVRPKMRHVSLTDVKYTDEELDVQGDVSGEEKITEGKSKLQQLRELKGK